MFVRQRPAVARSSAKRPHCFHPQLETLEDRLTPAAGALDPTFGTGGIVVTNPGISNFFQSASVLIQPDGKILEVASNTPLDNSIDPMGFALLRYNTNGTLDSSFGSGGMVQTIFVPSGGGYSSTYAGGGAFDGLGHVVVGGTSYPHPGSNSEWVLARYNLSDGSLDATFGTGGKLVPGVGGGINDIAIQADGKFVVAGNYIGRFNPDGSLDASFGNGGLATPTYGVSGLVLQADGSIVVAGTSSSDFALSRYTSNGTLDVTFGTNGTVTTNIGGATSTLDTCNDVALQADGKIVAVGKSTPSPSGGLGLNTWKFAVARYNVNGSLDTTFNSAGPNPGRVAELFENAGGALRDTRSGAKAVAIQANGKIVVSGSVLGVPATKNNPGTGANDFALARLNTDGTLDISFGGNGKVGANVDAGDWGSGLALQADGKIVQVAGTVKNAAQGPKTAVLRYLGDPPPAAQTASASLIAAIDFVLSEEAGKRRR